MIYYIILDNFSVIYDVINKIIKTKISDNTNQSRVIIELDVDYDGIPMLVMSLKQILNKNCRRFKIICENI